MLKVISRYGGCVIPNTQQIAADLDRRGHFSDCIRPGVDVETLHVDVCTGLNLFGAPRSSPGAERAVQAVQLPVHESLTNEQINRVAPAVAESLTPLSPAGAPTSAPPIAQSHR